ncbi:hypothetical protein B0H19DRAFT_979560 [Mycena capillaripes]|nr:hypothetical protein B0H19DRAFT_979560 [Mycena capillaripes]
MEHETGGSSDQFHSPLLETILAICSDELIMELSNAETLAHYGPMTVSDYLAMSVPARNVCAIEMVRDLYITRGYFAGWSYLASICVHIPLPSALVADVLTSIKLYDSIRPAATHTPQSPVSDLVMTITRGESHDSLYHVAPKNLGGKAWMSSTEYSEVEKAWSNTGFEPLSPCVSFGWLGAQRKTMPRYDRDHCDAMTLLGAVDFDMDRTETFASGFAGAFEMARSHTAATGTRMQGVALVALLNHDLQQYVRPIQEKWVRAAQGGVNLGPQAISAQDWVATLVADSTCICAYAYEGPEVYTCSKVGSFVGLLVSNTHDLLYDLATSNLMSSVMYAAAAGIVEDNLHCIFATSVADGIARRICISNSVGNILFGDNAVCGASAWAGFSERYRTWERFVKYSRQLSRSTSIRARDIAEKAVQQVILADCNLDDVTDAWHRLTTDRTSHLLVPRAASAYVPAAAPELVKGVLPDLCAACMAPFKASLNDVGGDEVRAIEGLSENVVGCRAVARAAAIRRAAIFATSQECCDVCACRIGCWSDITSHTVLTALMAGEQAASSAQWLLQCYTVWATMTFPVSVATILSGFDLACEMRQEEGAMGTRDVLDC